MKVTQSQPSILDGNLGRNSQFGALKAAMAASLLITAAGTAFSAETGATDCDPQILKMRTEFPAPARDRGAYGVVRVALKIDAEGRASDAQVTKSSGHRILDRAAIDSIRKSWRFDVAQCSPAELATKQTVDVQFHRPTGKMLTGATAGEVPATTRELLANNRCDVVREEFDNIYSCIDDSGR